MFVKNEILGYGISSGALLFNAQALIDRTDEA